MNSEELELSLRTEFENYLKSVQAEMRQDALEFQSKIETEFDKHKSQIDEAFKGFADRFDAKREFDDAFKGTVTEHLRLAKDEGAKITANAFAEAEDMQRAAAPSLNFSQLRDAINDISTKDSQSTILKSLVSQAEHFAPRGAFFIIKNGQFVGWKVFGGESAEAESAISEIQLPVAADTVLGAAVRSLSTADGSFGGHQENAEFLGSLHYGQPDRMYAIPMVARGRGVAVLYADYGTEGVSVNLEALETLVRIAALTVELHASTKTVKAENRQTTDADFEGAQLVSDEPRDSETGETSPPAETHVDDTHAEMHAESPVVDHKTSDFDFSDSVSFPGVFPVEPTFAEPTTEEHAVVEAKTETEAPQIEEAHFVETEQDAEAHHEEAHHEEVHHEEVHHEIDKEIADEQQMDYDSVAEETPAFETEKVHDESHHEFEHTAGEMVFDSDGSVEPAVMEYAPFEHTVEPFEPAVAIGGAINQVMDPVVEVSTPPVSLPRLSDRPVDLPIEVPESERRLHNDARRFARLLVSEIKLYNEKKVLEGRQANDLYVRLREAIDRSREMYDKRVQPPVVSKFDYFHYELVNALADGDQTRLGHGYPGESH